MNTNDTTTVTIAQSQVDHFHRNGFFFIPNPLGREQMRLMDRLQREREAEWEHTDWPEGFNVMACYFLMLGEPVLQMVEQPPLIEAAKRILDCDEVHIGACGLGDASKRPSATDGQMQQVHWHADGSPEVKQVSFRIALDRHESANAPLRVLPGTHLVSKEMVNEDLMQIELATGRHNISPDNMYARHPHEVEVILDPRWALVWTPSCWHATGVKTAEGPRRAMSWNYFPKGGRKRDTEAVKYIYSGQWPDWSIERQRLWGMVED